MAKEKVIHKVRRCKQCNEVYLPNPKDEGYCDECQDDWQPEPKRNDEHYLREPE